MNTRAVLGSIFASVAVLVVGWQAGAVVIDQTATPTSTSLPGNGIQSPGTTTSGGSGTLVAQASGTFTGDSVSTRFGSVQVAVTIAAGTITDITPVHLTDHDSKSVRISNRAAPLLRDAVLASQSADVSTVSGATYTSDAYLGSLQSALDQAGL